LDRISNFTVARALCPLSIRQAPREFFFDGTVGDAIVGRARHRLRARHGTNSWSAKFAIAGPAA
jgi:hypothetical protein